MITATVEYQVATYSGTIDVTFFEEVDNDVVIARAKAILIQKSGGSLPYGYQHFRVVRRDYKYQ
jgi:hypothetical protein